MIKSNAGVAAVVTACSLVVMARAIGLCLARKKTKKVSCKSHDNIIITQLWLSVTYSVCIYYII